MDSNALYIQQKASAREVPVQIIVQRVNDYVWNVENHAAQLTILANTFDQYRNELRDTHVTIILEGKKQEVMMQELNAMVDDLKTAMLKVGGKWISLLLSLPLSLSVFSLTRSSILETVLPGAP